MVEPSPLVFVHIPKTGGRTLEDIFRRPYKAAGQKWYEFEGGRASHERFCEMPLTERDSFDLLDGHCHYGIHRRLSRQATCLTMLREPVDRVISLYYYIHHCGELHYMYETVVKEGISLHEYVERLITVEVDNGQVRALNSEMLWECRKREVTRPMLEEAKRNLELGFDAFGLTERFDESLVLFRQALGWHDVDVRYRRHNVTQKRPKPVEVEPRTIDLIREVNRLDLELYEFARTLYLRRIEVLGKQFAEEVETFKSENRRFADSPPASALA